MLNCCIERKRARSLALLSGASSSAAAKAHDASRADGDASDDEFFECVEPPAGESAQQRPLEPTGRLGALELSDEEKQLVGGQSPIFVPVTQEQAPLTEDAIEQNTSILEQ